MGKILEHVFLMAPGQYQVSSGSGKITLKNIKDVIYAINRRAELDVPVGLKLDHSEDVDSIPVGVMKNAVIEGEESFADLHINQDAVSDRDGTGSKTLLTVDQIYNALKDGSMKLSIEAYRDVKAPAYYGDKTLSMEPTAWSILPVGVMPAVPRYKVAADRQTVGEQVVFSLDGLLKAENKDESEDVMNLEEALAKIEELETLNTSLQEELDELKKGQPDPEEVKEEEVDTEIKSEIDTLKDQLASAETKVAELERDKEEAERAAMEQRASELLEKVKAKLVSGKREGLDSEMSEIDSPSEKMAILGYMDRILPELEPDEEMVKAGTDNTGDSKQLQRVKAAEQTAEVEKITFVEALKKNIKEERG